MLGAFFKLFIEKEISQFDAICFQMSDDQDEFKKAKLKNGGHGKRLMILVDMFGATLALKASRIMKEKFNEIYRSV